MTGARTVCNQEVRQRKGENGVRIPGTFLLFENSNRPAPKVTYTHARTHTHTNDETTRTNKTKQKQIQRTCDFRYLNQLSVYTVYTYVSNQHIFNDVNGISHKCANLLVSSNYLLVTPCKQTAWEQISVSCSLS